MQNDSPPATKHYYTQYFYKYNFSTASPDLNIRQNLLSPKIITWKFETEN